MGKTTGTNEKLSNEFQEEKLGTGITVMCVELFGALKVIVILVQLVIVATVSMVVPNVEFDVDAPINRSPCGLKDVIARASNEIEYVLPAVKGVSNSRAIASPIVLSNPKLERQTA